jgi:membrane fusion protein (multidrug efflux system)
MLLQKHYSKLPLFPLLLAVGCIAMTACTRKAAAPPQNTGLPVNAAVAEERDVPIYGDWVGNLDGYVNAQIQPQVTGYLLKQDYKEGSLVQSGQVLFEIDPRPFQAALDQAKGQLAQAEAQLSLAKINLKRDTPLAAAHAISQSQLDNDVQQKAIDEAAVQTARANVEHAQINLEFTKVRSLITGIAGLAQTQVGNLVGPSATLTSVSQVDPIKAYFSISEQEYLALSGRAKSEGRSDLLHSGNIVPLQLTLGNGTVYPAQGHVVFVDRQINLETGTIRIAGSFPNPGNLLRPGQFGRIKAETDIRHGAVLVPSRAVSELQGSYQVAVIGSSNNTVEIRKVALGPQIGSEWIITSGVRPDEHVVTDGISKLKNGMLVAPQLEPSHRATTSQPKPEGN